MLGALKQLGTPQLPSFQRIEQEHFNGSHTPTHLTLFPTHYGRNGNISLVILVFLYVKYGKSCYLPPVGHLGLTFENEVPCFNELQETMLLHKQGQVRLFSTYNGLWKEPPCPRSKSAILVAILDRAKN